MNLYILNVYRAWIWQESYSMPGQKRGSDTMNEALAAFYSEDPSAAKRSRFSWFSCCSCCWWCWIFLCCRRQLVTCNISTGFYSAVCHMLTVIISSVIGQNVGKWPKRPKTKTAHANVKTAHVISPKRPLLGRFWWPKRPTQRSKMAPMQTEMTKTAQK